jgi:glycosyltransferase involved in cell wall biosynthesis
MVSPDATVWAAALDEWLRLAESGNLQAGGNAEAAAQHGWSSVANQYLRVYQQVLNND